MVEIIECPPDKVLEAETGDCVARGTANGALACDGGEAGCDGDCVDLSIDPENCGDCGVVCGAGTICVGGVCDPGCGAGLAGCDGECVDLSNDPGNCGDCGVVCGAGTSCVGGVCDPSCGAGLADCDGACVDLSSDSWNCGGCGVVCGLDEICVNGSCELDCAPGLTACGDRCVDISTSPQHCGECHFGCPVLHVCESGNCEEVGQDPLTPIERDLYEAINEYRAEHGLAAIPLSYSLTFVARAHVQDLNDHGSTVLAGDCNLHSWSDQGNWTPCCYTSDHAEASCMWNKPREMTNYTGTGFEISTTAARSAAAALNSWKGSSGHRNVILNEGAWATMTWRAIGVGIDGGYSHVWFSTAVDPDDW